MLDRLRFLWCRVGEMLWVKPLAICFLSIAAAFIAQMADQLTLLDAVPEVDLESIKALLSVISASMLVIAVFTVGSMLSAYQSATNTATPRTFTLVVADDVSQNALSTFIGAFIFSIVAQVALMNGYYGDAGRFALFVLTVLVFALVIFSFIRWVDRIARLGRLGTLIEKVESATQTALNRQLKFPFMRAQKAEGNTQGIAIYSDTIGYIQRIDIAALQAQAEKMDAFIEVATLPGVFITPDKPLAYLRCENTKNEEIKNFDEAIAKKIVNAFGIGRHRTFDNDPRFGLVVLSEIASRALSPAVNDPGTAISIIGVLVRLFASCVQAEKNEPPNIDCDRVAVPTMSLNDCFDDAFNPIARDGAGLVEVGIRLQKGLAALAALDNPVMQNAAIAQAKIVYAHAQTALKVPQELDKLKALSGFALEK